MTSGTSDNCWGNTGGLNSAAEAVGYGARQITKGSWAGAMCGRCLIAAEFEYTVCERPPS